MGATLSLGCGSGGRSLLTSAGNGDTGTVREVLASRPDLAAYTYLGNGQNVIHVAAANGDREVLQAVVDVLHTAARVPNSGDEAMNIKEQTLHAVTLGRHLKEVVNARSNSGQTPLMLACQHGHVSCVNFLLNCGADVFQVDKAQRRSAIHYAAANGQAGVLRALLDDNQLMHTEDGLQALKHVRVHDMSGQCRYIDSRAENGVTALHLAAVYGEIACVHVLLAAGASMMVRTVDLDMFTTVSMPAGSTPLHLAAQKGQVAILQAMLQMAGTPKHHCCCCKPGREACKSCQVHQATALPSLGIASQCPQPPVLAVITDCSRRIHSQAHADALGNWAREDGQDRGGRRGWEQDGRIDLRSVANSLRQLPYHVAWQRGFREAAQVLNPTIPIDVALENVRELEEGFGSQKLQTLAAYALRKNLLGWLEVHQVDLERADLEREQRQLRERVIADQRRKEALKLHSEESVDASIHARTTQLVSADDAGHTFAVPVPLQAAAAGPPIQAIPEESRELRSSAESVRVGEDQQLHSPPPSAFSQATQPLSSPPSVELADTASISAEAAAEPGSSVSSPRVSRNSSETTRKPPASGKQRSRLLPSRPAPPPPARALSASQRALALLTAPQQQAAAPICPGHSRKASREALGSRRTTRDGADEPRSSSQDPWVDSPFASPFAQVSQRPAPDAGEDTGPVRRAQLDQHPSGINLVDPPDLSRGPSLADVPSQPPSRKSSKTLLGGLPSFSSKSRKNLQPGKNTRQASGRLDFQRAASIPGFDNNLDADEDCGICLDQPVNVGIDGCDHKLCCGCALKLCQVNKKPPLCPFCRTFIEGFHAPSCSHT